MRARYQWVVLLTVVFPVGLAACSSGAPAITGVVAIGTATTGAALNGAFDNAGISSNADPAAGNLDGGGYSYSAQALAAVGLTPGASLTHDGLTFTWPDVPAGEPDNVLASGQTIAVSGSGTLGFLGASDYYSSSGTGTITYTDGTTQSFALPLADWWANTAAPGGDILVSVPYMNTSSGKMDQKVSVYYAAVQLEAGKTVQSVTLPDVSQQAVQGSPAMHIFGIAVSAPGGSGGYTPAAITLCTRDQLNGALKFLPDCQALLDCATAISPVPMNLTDILQALLTKAERDLYFEISVAKGCGEIACKYQPLSIGELLGLPWYLDEQAIERQFECAGFPRLFIKGGGLYLGAPTGEDAAPLK
jgi:hypothetical protein